MSHLTPPCLAAALDYRKRGWCPIALCPADHAGVSAEHAKECVAPGLTPLWAWEEYTRRLPSEAELRLYWNRCPEANVGIMLGPISRLTSVVDQKGHWPETLEFHDGQGRSCRLFALPDGSPQPAGPRWIALPPSRHGQGQWSWREGHSPDLWGRLPTCPVARQVSNPPHGEQSSATTLLLDSLAVRPVRWLWPGRIPLGKITVFDGDPGLGKSTVLLDLAARLSQGLPMPDGTGGLRGAVTLMTAEDNLADTVRPRLEAAGADLTRIHALDSLTDAKLGSRPPVIPLDLPILVRVLEQTASRLLILDPFVAFLGGNIDSCKDQDIRRCLHRLAEVAEHTGCAVILLRHLAKARGGNVLYRGTGSIGIIGAARSGLLVARDPMSSSQRILAVTKSNLAETPPALRFCLEPTDAGVCRIAWEGPCDLVAGDLLDPAPGAEDHDRLEEAIQFLQHILEDGPVPADLCLRRAGSLRISEKTLRRAKTRIHIKSIRESHGPSGRWLWALASPSLLNPPCHPPAPSAEKSPPPESGAVTVKAATSVTSPAEAAGTCPSTAPSLPSASAASSA